MMPASTTAPPVELLDFPVAVAPFTLVSVLVLAELVLATAVAVVVVVASLLSESSSYT